MNSSNYKPLQTPLKIPGKKDEKVFVHGKAIYAKEKTLVAVGEETVSNVQVEEEW